MEIPKDGLKLNIAAGGKRIAGWLGVDAVERLGADLIGTMTDVPLPDECANEVMVIHGVEHLFPWEVPDALGEWFRLMRSGAKLTLEMPDFLKCCKNIAEDFKGRKHPDQQGMWGVWGDDRLKDPLMRHKSGWWFERLKPLVEEARFHKITEHQTVFHPVGRSNRDFRLEAYKP